jgi:hypothetical protein
MLEDRNKKYRKKKALSMLYQKLDNPQSELPGKGIEKKHE